MEGGISFDIWGQALVTSMHMSICFCAFEYFSVYHHVFYNCIPSFHILFCLYLCAWAVLFLLSMICCSVAQSCQTLCEPMDCRMSGFPVPHHLLKLAQTHVHWVSDAIQPRQAGKAAQLTIFLSENTQHKCPQCLTSGRHQNLQINGQVHPQTQLLSILFKSWLFMDPSIIYLLN